MSNITAIKNSDGTVDLVGRQGTTWELFLTLKNPDGTPMNITGYTFRGQFRTSYQAAEKTDFVCGIVSAGEGRMSVSAAEQVTSGTAAYKESINAAKLGIYKGAGVYVYDIEMVDVSGRVSRLLEGKLYVDPEATK